MARPRDEIGKTLGLPIRLFWQTSTSGARPMSISVYQFILSPSVGIKPQFLPFFGLRHLLLLPIGNSLTKLNTGAQLQTFPYPTALKSFLYSNAFIAKLGAQSLTFKSMTNKQTDKKINVFDHPVSG